MAATVDTAKYKIFRQPARAIAVAIGATAAVAISRLIVSDTLGNFAPLIPFVISVVIAAWYGGLKPGLLATALSAVAADYLFIPTQHSLHLANATGAVALALFIVTGILISWTCESLHRARRLLEKEQQTLRTSLAAQVQLQAALQASDRRKDEFLATLAHELRNPLAPIRNAVHILRTKAPFSKETQEAQAIIGRQVQQMTRLIEDLMDVARITQGLLALRRDRVNIADVIGNAVETSRPLVDACQHDLRVSLLDHSVYIEADALRLSQVISNLLNNAAKYTPVGGRIHLQAELIDQELSLTVTDNGLGIPELMLNRIFEPFTQLEHSAQRSQGGLGIGLALSKQLVRLHGGDLTAHSGGVGKGSTFTIRLPIGTSQLPIPEVAAAPNAHSHGMG